jgi:hypothetical protein
MKQAMVLLSLFLATRAVAQSETREFETKGLHHILIESDSGEIKIGSTNRPKAVVQAEKLQFGKHCRLTMERTSDKLIARVRRIGTESGACEVDWNVQVPRRINAELLNGAGDIDVTNLKGNIRFEVGSGDATIHSEVSILRGRTGSGNIIVHGAVREARLTTGTGNVSITYTKSPESGGVRVVTGTGNTQLIFPAGTKIQTHFVSANGRLTNAFGDNRGAKFKISVASGMGDLNITKVSQISE